MFFNILSSPIISFLGCISCVSYQGEEAESNADIPQLDGLVSGARDEIGTRASSLLQVVAGGLVDSGVRRFRRPGHAFHDVLVFAQLGLTVLRRNHPHTHSLKSKSIHS